MQAIAVCCFSSVMVLANALVAFAENSLPDATLFRDYQAVEFRKLDAAQQKIDPEKLNEPLLSAAIFHETNLRRAEQNLPTLAFHENVRAASIKHAQAMGKHSTLSHGTPWKPEQITAYDRLREQGLQASFAAENIAFNFVLRYESGKPFYTREEGGRTVYSYEPGGEPLQSHTFVSFAEAILTQWMNSPEHRKNIVATEAQFLGVGCARAKDPNGFDTIYADQDFFAPLVEVSPLPQR